MKPALYNLLFILAIVFTYGCGTSSGSSSGKQPPDKNTPYKNYTNLADVLRSQPGLIVTGYGGGVSISIRGQNSLMLDTRPLFEINGVNMGREYSMVNDAITPQEIRSVQVLSSLSETNRYGEMGRNGVIRIRTNTVIHENKKVIDNN